MKNSLFTLAVLMCVSINANAQNIIVQQNNNSSSTSTVQDNKGYFINGISTKEDIGGVDVEFVDDPENYYANKYLKFTNYHNFPVTIIFEVEDYQRGGYYEKVTGSITLRANETKTTPNPYNVAKSRHCVMIVRRIGSAANAATQSTISNSEYVDLGLPSGTLWKTKNEKGFYYTWEEAVDQFGDKLPSKQHFLELKAFCDWTWNGNGYLIIGSNGNSIELPACGLGQEQESVGESGFYWTSTTEGASAWILCFGKDEIFYFRGSTDGQLSVRLIK